MGRFWRLLGEYDAETTTWSAFAVSGFSSPYTPDFNGKLIGLRAFPSGAAATTLMRHVEFRLTCSNWRPNTVEIGVQGSGLETAPLLPNRAVDWQVDQPITAGVPIVLEGRNVTAATPVSVECVVYGLFDAG